MNEFWFFVITIVDLAFVLFAWRLGKEWLYLTIVVNVVLVSAFASKLIPIFGFVTNVSNTFYAAIFIATDILSEHHGKKEGYRSVWMGFLGLTLFVFMSQGVLQFEAFADSETVSDAMNTVFSAVPRIAAASFIAYAIAQTFDVWFFHKLKEGRGAGARFLWLRNTASTVSSQLLDSIVFFSLAFAGSVPFNTLINIIVTGWAVKVFVALLDTPFMYLSYPIIGKRVPDNFWSGPERTPE